LDIGEFEFNPETPDRAWQDAERLTELNQFNHSV